MNKQKLVLILIIVITSILGGLYVLNVRNDSAARKALLDTAILLGYQEDALLSIETNTAAMYYDNIEILYSTKLSLAQLKNAVNGMSYKQRNFYDIHSDSNFPGPPTTQLVTNELFIVNPNGVVAKLNEPPYANIAKWVLIEPTTKKNVEINYIELTDGYWLYKNKKIEGNLILISLDRMN